MMTEEREFHPGDIVSLKKKHPCGSYEWEIMRLGADIRLKCKGCGHFVMIPRSAFKKAIKMKKNN